MARARSSNKRFERLLRASEAAGARVSGGGHRHFKVYPADGSRMIVLPTTGFDGAMMQKLEARLRRAGIRAG